MKRTSVGDGKVIGRATGERVKKQSKAARKSAVRAKETARKAARKAEEKAHRAAVKAEANAHRAAVKAEAQAHKEAVKAERRAHKQALKAHAVVVPDPEPDHEEPREAIADDIVRASTLGHGQAEYEIANQTLDEARRAFADLDWTTHTREDWIAASARLRQAWAAVDAARAVLQS